MMKAFGFEINFKKASNKGDQENFSTPVREVLDEPTVEIPALGSFDPSFYIHGGVDASSKKVNTHELVKTYRTISKQPECDTAISDIVDSAISAGLTDERIKLDLEALDYKDNVKEAIHKEYKILKDLLDLDDKASDFFRSFYVDGSIYFSLVVEDGKEEEGIKDIRKVDPIHLIKVREIEKSLDDETKIVKTRLVDEYYLYNDIDDKFVQTKNGIKLTNDSIVCAHSGLRDEENKMNIGYLHKAIKVVNNLSMLEDALVIYRLARAPERRIFYIDTGNLTSKASQEYVNSVASSHKKKLTYNSETGEVGDSSKSMNMLEDYFLPRREGGKGTEISTLSGGENLGQIDDVIFFQKKLYKSLNVPLSRLDEESTFSFNTNGEMSREEVKHQKFVDSIRKKFSKFVLDALRIQLVLKNVVTEEEWKEIKNDIKFNFVDDNYFSQLKELEVLSARHEVLEGLGESVGIHYSNNWVRKNVLGMTDEEMRDMEKEIKDEKKSMPQED